MAGGEESWTGDFSGVSGGTQDPCLAPSCTRVVVGLMVGSSFLLPGG